MLSFIKKFITDMFCDHNGRWSHKKIGEVIVGSAWTYYMVKTMPESVEMWLAYSTVLLTWSTTGLVMKTRPWEKKAGVEETETVTKKTTTVTPQSPSGE